MSPPTQDDQRPPTHLRLEHRRYGLPLPIPVPIPAPRTRTRARLPPAHGGLRAGAAIVTGRPAAVACRLASRRGSALRVPRARDRGADRFWTGPGPSEAGPPNLPGPVERHSPGPGAFPSAGHRVRRSWQVLVKKRSKSGPRAKEQARHGSTRNAEHLGQFVLGVTAKHRHHQNGPAGSCPLASTIAAAMRQARFRALAIVNVASHTLQRARRRLRARGADRRQHDLKENLRQQTIDRIAVACAARCGKRKHSIRGSLGSRTSSRTQGRTQSPCRC